MKSTLGEELRVFVFEGESSEIKAQVNAWMKGPGAMFEIMDIKYNFQGTQYTRRVPISGSARHGVLIVARQLTANDVRERRGLPRLPLPTDDRVVGGEGCPCSKGRDQ